MKRIVWLMLGLLGLTALGAEEASRVELELASDHRYYPEGRRNTVFVQTTIRVAPDADESSAPLRNLCLVVDRSGSMSGAMMQALRQSVTSALDQLSPDDVVSLVAFGSEVETVVESQRRGALQNVAQTIQRIEPAGGTALYDALNQAAAQIRRRAGPASINHLLVICDGKPNKGPREREDFTRLAELFAREGISISTIGLGTEFDEDLLADLASLGGGRFHYARGPDDLDPAIAADLAPFQSLVGHDVVLTLTFHRVAREVESFGWNRGVVDGQTVTWHLPQLMADQLLPFSAAAELPSTNARISMYDFARAKLTWTDVAGQPHSREAVLQPLFFSMSNEAVQVTLNETVFRESASQIVTDAMEEAIALLDEGKFDKALRLIQRARHRVVWINSAIDDAVVEDQIRELDRYLEEVRARGLNQVDRKILRSGLFNRFAPPATADPEETETGKTTPASGEGAE